MNIVCVQMNIDWENKAPNHARALALLDASPPPPGSLILLPEMFATGFSMNVPAATDSPAHLTHRFLADLARRFQSHVLGGLVTTTPAGRGRNEAVLFAPDGSEAGRYHKHHPFTPGGESTHYDAGANLLLIPWAGFTFCPFICYDLRFPEIFRAATRRGADLFAVIASWPSARVHHWVTLAQARAIENQAYVAAINRVGTDPKFTYPGRSLIIDPRGAIIADAADRESILQHRPDLAALRAYRAELPFLADMRNTQI